MRCHGSAALVVAVAALARGKGTSADRRLAAEAGAAAVPGRNTNDVWTARFDDSDIVIKAFVGQQVDGAEREWAGLHLFSSLTPDQVPRPLLFDTEHAVIAMSRVAGSPLADAELTGPQLDALASWLRGTTTHQTNSDPRPARTAPPQLIPNIRRWWVELRTVDHDDAVVQTALRATDEWLDGTELDSLLTLPLTWLTRGDSNLANCLWSDALGLVDFEDFGWSHPAVFLGDLMEHIRAHANTEDTWTKLLDLVELPAADRPSLLTVRRRFAMFWLMQLLPGGRGADRNPPEALPRQAQRVLTLLDATIS
jgi:hypothetical protein